MKLFVSYRRAAWSFAYWLIEELSKLIDAEIFIDFQGIDDSNFERSLLHHLHDSDVMLLIVTEHTFAPERIHHDKDWVRREIREALTHEKPIVLACQNGIMPPADLPDDIQAIRNAQGIEFYPRYFKAGVHELAVFMDRATPIKLKNRPTLLEKPISEPPASAKSDKERFDEATALAEAGHYDEAIELLQALKAHGYKPRYITLEHILADVIRDRTTEQRRWEAGEIYDEIVSVSRVSLERAKSMYAQFRTNYPEYTEDPAQINPLLNPPQISPSKQRKSIGNPVQISHEGTAEQLPDPFDWIEIPAGLVTGEGLRKTDVPAFSIAKYPITNAQFARFMEAGGYNHEQWWTEQGWQFKENGNWMKPRYWQDHKWNKPNCPVVGISWFEAVAFCLWLSSECGENISLPTEPQWQWAAHGSERWVYPWGEGFDTTYCNNSVETDWRKNSTSDVTLYEGKGDSRFGVVDMSGNAWEWCLTAAAQGDQDIHSNALKRVLKGGSWYLTDPYAFRIDFRTEDIPNRRNDFASIRLVRIP